MSEPTESFAGTDIDYVRVLLGQAGKEQMKIKLRQLQWKHAALGNTALLIFLGKQYLGQSEKQEVDFSGNLETILKECGYVDNPIKDAEKDTE